MILYEQRGQTSLRPILSLYYYYYYIILSLPNIIRTNRRRYLDYNSDSRLALTHLAMDPLSFS